MNTVTIKSKKQFAIVLIAAMVFACMQLASCAIEKNETERATEMSTEKIYPYVPEADYGGYNFKILVSLNSAIEVWNDFHAEEETGDTLNDAIYKRNMSVEEKYNVKITDMEMPPLDANGVNRPDTQKIIKNSVQAGDNAYDAAVVVSYAASELALGGFLMDMNSMAEIDLKNQWWDQKANEDLMLKNKMFYTTGDISNAVNQAAFAIAFNKKLLQEFGLENPYDLVKNGKWTYDRLGEMCADVSADLNGDGKYDFSDLYGALVWGDTTLAVVNSIGEKCVKINSGGELELTLNSERVISSLKSFTDLAFDKTRSFQYQNHGDWLEEKAMPMFENDQALFYLKTMQLAVRLRAMETDFGILPYPKLDAAQKNYYTTVSSWDAGFLCVPESQEDVSRTAAILEALAIESMHTLKPAYYELTLKGKYIRDDESEEMIDLIFSSKIYDLGWFYRVGMLYAEMMYLNYNYDSDFASMYERNFDKASADVDTINEAFAKVLK